MPNMSTVAIVVPYCRHKIIDITANMFINLNAYKSAIGLFDQFRSACKVARADVV